MEHIDKVSAEAQIYLLQALIKEVEVFDKHIILKLYIHENKKDYLTKLKVEETESPNKLGNLIEKATVLEPQGSPKGQRWRVERDTRRTLETSVTASLFLPFTRGRGVGQIIKTYYPQTTYTRNNITLYHADRSTVTDANKSSVNRPGTALSIREKFSSKL